MNMLSKYALSNFSENRVAERLAFISSSYFLPEAYTISVFKQFSLFIQNISHHHPYGTVFIYTLKTA